MKPFLWLGGSGNRRSRYVRGRHLVVAFVERVGVAWRTKTGFIVRRGSAGPALRPGAPGQRGDWQGSSDDGQDVAFVED